MTANTEEQAATLLPSTQLFATEKTPATTLHQNAYGNTFSVIEKHGNATNYCRLTPINVMVNLYIGRPRKQCPF
jgi:hypothetical protein